MAHCGLPQLVEVNASPFNLYPNSQMIPNIEAIFTHCAKNYIQNYTCKIMYFACIILKWKHNASIV